MYFFVETGDANVYETAVAYEMTNMYKLDMHYLSEMAKQDNNHFVKEYRWLSDENVGILAEIAIVNNSWNFLEELSASRPFHRKIVDEKIKMMDYFSKNGYREKFNNFKSNGSKERSANEYGRYGY